MITTLIELFKNSPIKSVSVTTLLFLAILVAGVLKLGDSRYCLAEDSRQMQQSFQQYQAEQLKTQIFVLNLKEKGATQEQIDAALKERYERMLEDLND